MEYYNVFYTDKPFHGTKPDFSLTMPLRFTSVEDALKQAFKLIYGGAIVWKIEGPGGFRLDRPEIERRYWLFKRR